MKKFKSILIKSGCIISFSLLLLLGTVCSSYANSPAIYYFNDPWNNKGDAEVFYDCASPEELVRLNIGDFMFSPSDYIISGDENGSKIIIKEDVLKKLSLELGFNYIWAELKGRTDTTIPHCGYFLEEGESTMIIPKYDNAIKILRITNMDNHWENEIEVDSKNYTVTETKDNFIVEFNKEYLNSLSKKGFAIYCLKNSFIILKLIKGEKADVNCDGKINITDVIETLQASLGMVEVTNEMSKLGDMDNDGKITVNDVTQVLKKALDIN